jgi:hypothetical protein
MESFFSSLKTERTARKPHRTRGEARADVFDYFERFYNPKRRHSTIGYLSPMEFEQRFGFLDGGQRNRLQASVDFGRWLKPKLLGARMATSEPSHANEARLRIRASDDDTSHRTPAPKLTRCPKTGVWHKPYSSIAQCFRGRVGSLNKGQVVGNRSIDFNRGSLERMCSKLCEDWPAIR